MREIKIILLFVILIFNSKVSLFAQTEDAKISKVECKELIEKIGKLLVDEYIFPLKAGSR